MSVWNDFLEGSILAAALACGVMAGVFFAFSSFVMKAFASLPAAEGIRAMQAINVVAVRSVFLPAFLATTVACLVLGGISLGRLGQPEGWPLLLGSVVYLAGGFLLTVLFNVPMNDRLAALNPKDPEAGGYWAHYLARWTAWNHLRTLACLAAAALFTFAWLAAE